MRGGSGEDRDLSEFGISHGGRFAEEAFIRLTGAVRAPSASKGDAILEGHLIEVKQATKVTLNQVRAVKYLPLVVLYVPSDRWYVIPAHEVVQRVARKTRGQHTEIAFECATLSLGALQEFHVEDPDALRSRTIEAAEESAQFVELRSEMERVLDEARQLASKSRERVLRILGQPD